MKKYWKLLTCLPDFITAVIDQMAILKMSSTMGFLLADTMYKAIMDRDTTFAQQCLDVLESTDPEVLAKLDDKAVAVIKAQLKGDIERNKAVEYVN